MKNLLNFTLGIALTVTLSNATAQTYQWKDSSGRTVVSDTPPPGAVKESARTIGGNAPTATTTNAKPADAPKTIAEKDLEFKKRQQESAEKAGKDAKEAAANAERRDNCERAKRQLALIESGQRIATTDEKGERRIMEDAERAQEMARAQKFASESCK
jgi:hypothetical protein